MKVLVYFCWNVWTLNQIICYIAKRKQRKRGGVKAIQKR